MQVSECSTVESHNFVPYKLKQAQFKTGSLQEYVTSKGSIENFSHSLFSAEEVHKIAVLDLRILNLDRNLCNILVASKHS